jgi:hypothetical protein
MFISCCADDHLSEAGFVATCLLFRLSCLTSVVSSVQRQIHQAS